MVKNIILNFLKEERKIIKNPSYVDKYLQRIQKRQDNNKIIEKEGGKRRHFFDRIDEMGAKLRDIPSSKERKIKKEDFIEEKEIPKLIDIDKRIKELENEKLEKLKNPHKIMLKSPQKIKGKNPFSKEGNFMSKGESNLIKKYQKEYDQLKDLYRDILNIQPDDYKEEDVSEIEKKIRDEERIFEIHEEEKDSDEDQEENEGEILTINGLIDGIIEEEFGLKKNEISKEVKNNIELCMENGVEYGEYEHEEIFGKFNGMDVGMMVLLAADSFLKTNSL